jgi:hypothetical protein
VVTKLEKSQTPGSDSLKSVLLVVVSNQSVDCSPATITCALETQRTTQSASTVATTRPSVTEINTCTGSDTLDLQGSQV